MNRFMAFLLFFLLGVRRAAGGRFFHHSTKPRPCKYTAALPVEKSFVRPDMWRAGNPLSVFSARGLYRVTLRIQLPPAMRRRQKNAFSGMSHFSTASTSTGGAPSQNAAAAPRGTCLLYTSVYSMMSGIQHGDWDAAVFTGYHAAACCDGNPLSHTMNTSVDYVEINGVRASEFTLNAYMAGYHGCLLYTSRCV